ncbi:hypothetical protein ACVIGB_001013 [Bradyrhizobium sp. USDA 4341]
MSKSAIQAINRLARTYPLLVDLVKDSDEFWSVPGLFRSADSMQPSELYHAVVKQIRNHGMSCGDTPVPPLSEALMKRLARRKNPFSDREEHVFEIAFALDLASRLPAQWFPASEAGFLNLIECGRHTHSLLHHDGCSGNLLENALQGDGMGLDLSDEDLCMMFRRSGESGFEQSPHDAYVARCGEVPGAIPMGLSYSEVLAVYGVKLAGHEVKFVEWQTNGHGRRQPWRKYWLFGFRCWNESLTDRCRLGHGFMEHNENTLTECF